MAIIQDIELNKKRIKLLYTILILFLIIGGIVQLLPLTWLAIGTFKTNQELISAVPKFFPAEWSFDAYTQAFTTYDIWNNIYNTVFVCVAIILIQTTTSTLAAYSLSKVRPKCSGFVYMMFLGTQMFNATALMFPTYIMMTKMGLIGTKWAWILSASGWAYAIVLYKSFFDNIPKDLIESADIDGASTFRKIVNIIIPLSGPIYAVNMLNTFMAVYNDFIFPLVLLPNEKDWTLMIRIYILQKGSVPQNVMYVLLFVTCIPSILFYLLAQKNIQEGISTTGIKG